MKKSFTKQFEWVMGMTGSTSCFSPTRRLLLLLCLILVGAGGAKAQSYQTFDANKCYTKVLIDAKINDFAGNTKPMGFGSYNSETDVITQPQWKTDISNGSNRDLVMDYVAGLVAKACIEAADYYKDFTWSKPWFKLVENYATKVTVPTTGASLDDLNASKMYFALAELTKTGAKYANSTTYNKAISELKNAIAGLTAVNKDYSIHSGSSVNYYNNGKDECSLVNLSGKSVSPNASGNMNAIGGWYHKATYPNQMWCDSEYMGPALLAQLVAYATKNSSAGIGTVTGTTEGDWKLIAKQFDITWNYLWNSTDQLLYHGFSATPTAIAAHTHTWATGTNGTNAAYWGRAIGWYFLALVDVLENMPDDISDNTYINEQNNLNSRDANIKKRLTSYLKDLAEGIWKQKKDNNLWTNVIDEAVGAEHKSYSTTDAVIQSNTKNYLEASASAIYIAAYIKAMRLGLLPSSTYESGIKTAYQNYISNFITTDNDIINTCASAGLGGGNVNISSASSDYKSGGKKYRDGTADYYTRGYDVTKVTNYQEGKPLGAFILASTEYERFMKDDYEPSFEVANAEIPTAQTVTKGQSVTLHAAAMAKPLAEYKWYSYPATSTRSTTEGTLIPGATSSDLTVTPQANTYYYCEATNSAGSTQTVPVLVTVSEESNEGTNAATEKEAIISLANKNNTCTDANSIVTVDVSKSQPNSSSDFCKVAKGNSFTVSSEKTIKKIVINYLSGYVPEKEGAVTVNTGKFVYNTTSTSSTWTGTATSVTFTDDSTNGNDLHITSIEVTYLDGTPSSLSITQPVGATYDYGVSEKNVTALSVAATATGIEGDITYQWYSNTTNSNTNGTPINGATEASYKPDVQTAGTTYYYCVVSAGGNTVTSNAVAVAVLNPSDLKTTDAYGYAGNAWTPAANGTIDVSKLVSSSSKGAYSITSGIDVATISGTTITALKAGTFTLSQEVDDKYKPGTIEITVRIGTDVTSDETNEYSFTAQTDVSDGMTIACKDITMTFGNDGFWSQPSADRYTNGQRNPIYPESGSDAYIPTAGTYYKFTPTKPGQLAVNINLGTKEIGGNHCLRPLFVSENGTLISAKLDDNTQVGKGETPEHVKYTGNVTFDVKKGIDYYIFVNSSKVGFKSFTFTPATTYTITYNMNGHGTQIEEVTDVNTLPETLPTPTADGYTFVGWYTDSELTTAAEAGATLTDDVTLYAKWTPITDLFTLTVVTSETETVKVDSRSSVDVSSKYATITGGSAQLYNGHSEQKDMISSSQINLNGSSASYLKITLDNTLKAGDEIIINPSTSSFKLSATSSNSGIDPFTGSYVIQEGDAVVEKNVIYLYKGSNSLITDINITRYYPESDSRATFTYGSSQLTFTETTEGTYTTTLEIGASKKGRTITITPTAQDGATIKQNGTTVSGDITITVPSTIGNTTTSTYTVTSKDETSTTTYEINVKLVKENVVLVYAQSDGKTAWTWDKTANSTRPTFTNPTLKVYLANADGTKSDKEVTNVTGIKYMSDVTDVATVGESTGTITIKDNANGGAKIYAILENNDYYNDAQTFFNIIVKQGYSYSVADDAAIANGPDLNESVYIKNGDTKLVKMTFGGWKWSTFEDTKDNNKLKSTYVVNGSTKTDAWNKATTSKESEIASIDGYKTSISGATDAVDESKEASDKAIYGSIRYGWFKSPVHDNDGKTTESYPYTLPVRGSFMTFEPTMNGTLTIYILQNGAWNTNDDGGTYEQVGDGSITYEKGDIIPGQFRPHAFQVVNQRGLTVQEFSPNYSVSTKQKVDSRYYCMFKGDEDYNETKYNNPFNVAKWKEFAKYMSTEEQQRAHDSWNSGPLGAQKIIELDNGSFLAVQKGIVKYTFHVTGNETYYFFSNFSKMGFSGANFVPDVSQPQETVSDKISTLDLSDVKAYSKITPTENGTIAGTNLKNYTYKIGETDIAPVAGVSIPQFYSIKLTRNFKKDQWTTLTLPFNLTEEEVQKIFGDGTQLIQLNNAKVDNGCVKLEFIYHEIQNVLPGHPYLIKPTLTDITNDANVTVAKDNNTITNFTVYSKCVNPFISQVDINCGAYTFKGVPGYSTPKETSTWSVDFKENDIFVSDGDGKMYVSAGSSHGKGYRAWFEKKEATPGKINSISLEIDNPGDDDDNVVTTIDMVDVDPDVFNALGIATGVYNLNGQKVSDDMRSLPKGIYIVNGKKIVRK